MKNKENDRDRNTHPGGNKDISDSSVTEMRDTREQHAPNRDRGKDRMDKSSSGREHGNRHSQKNTESGGPSRQTSTASEEKGQL